MALIGQTVRWIVGGPDIPMKLIQSAQDGNLVLFCGAGVSRRAGLPDFAGLVRQLYQDLNPSVNPHRSREFKEKRFDALLWTLERTVGTEQFRKALISRLTLHPEADIETHRALVRLATTGDGKCRLVTTNVDWGFDVESIPMDIAPKLPIPKKDILNGVVYMHGRIGNHDPSGRSLIVTSADFGAAYLTEGWAARFVTELFRRYSVLFVGYSIDDPVMRYMMDALAADRSSHEAVGEAYVFVGTSTKEAEGKRKHWESRDMIPILYDERDCHEILHTTIRKWSQVHAQGMLGRQAVVEEWASFSPARPFQDEVVSQMVWAVSQPLGGIARRFAELDPVPPIEWLAVFEECGLLSGDVGLERIETSGALCDQGFNRFQTLPLSPVSGALSRWLCSHIDHPEAVSWALRSGGCLHPALREMIRRHLSDQNVRIRGSLRTIWSVLSSEQYQPNPRGFLHHGLQAALLEGLWNSVLKSELLGIFRPALRLKPSLLGASFGNEFDTFQRYADLEMRLSGGQAVVWMLDHLSGTKVWEMVLAEIADDMTTLLKNAFELFEDVEEASEMWDPSLSAFPLIESNPDHRFDHEWTVLISLARDSWRGLVRKRKLDGKRLVERWKLMKYPVFRRLTFLAMTESDLYSAQESIQYLIDESDGRWLWSEMTREEMLALIRKRWPETGTENSDRLVAAVLAGPQGRNFDAETEREHIDLMVLDRLQVLHDSRGGLPDHASERLSDLLEKYPPESRKVDWGQITAGTFTVSWRSDISPEEDQWRDEWKKSVSDLSDEEHQVPGKMAEFLSHWQGGLSGLTFLTEVEKRRPWKTWTIALRELSRQDESFFSANLGTLNAQIEQAAKLLPAELDSDLWPLWDRVLEQAAMAPAEPGVPYGSIEGYYRSPLSTLADALFARAAKRDLVVRGGLPTDISERLELLLVGIGPLFEAARVEIARRLYWLFAVDPAWTRDHLVPRFQWQRSGEACGLWQGFLRNPQFTPDLWLLLKSDFLETVRQRSKLGDNSAKTAAQVFAGICLQGSDLISFQEAKLALENFSIDELARIAWLIWRRVVGAEEQCTDYWCKTAGPWFQKCWPMATGKQHGSIALWLASATLASGNAFPKAVETLRRALLPIDDFGQIARKISSQPETFPHDTLSMLAAIVDTSKPHASQDLETILHMLENAEPEIADQREFCRLRDYCIEHGQWRRR